LIVANGSRRFSVGFGFGFRHRFFQLVISFAVLASAEESNSQRIDRSRSLRCKSRQMLGHSAAQLHVHEFTASGSEGSFEATHLIRHGRTHLTVLMSFGEYQQGQRTPTRTNAYQRDQRQTNRIPKIILVTPHALKLLPANGG